MRFRSPSGTGAGPAVAPGMPPSPTFADATGAVGQSRVSGDGSQRTPEAVLRRLEWKVVRRLDGRLQGNYRTLLHGEGIDVADLREYEPGDDVRHIDWNVTARTDIAHVRTYQEDRELTAWLLLDRSASMRWGPKEALMNEVAVTLARVLTRGGNPVGAILLTNGDGIDNRIERTLPPGNSRNHVLYLTRHLLRATESPRGPAGERGDRRARRADRKRRRDERRGDQAGTRLGDLLEVAGRTIRRRSLVIVLSDFYSEPGWERPFMMLSQRHEVVAISLHDPRERQFVDIGFQDVEDAETGEVITVDTSDPEFKKRFQAVAEEQRAELNAAARRAGVDLHEISTEEDLVGALVRIVESRRRRRGRR